MLVSDKKLVEQIESRAKALGVSMETLCDKAGCASSTFIRQKRGESRVVSAPFRRILEALERLENQHAAAANSMAVAEAQQEIQPQSYQEGIPGNQAFA